MVKGIHNYSEIGKLRKVLLHRIGSEVLTVLSSELSRGRGGPRCMSCPVRREDL